MESMVRSQVVDPTDGEGLEKLGCFASRYPEICPFCFSKYPDGDEDRAIHIRACSKLAREIRNEDRMRRR
jgi:hypothetical protein